MPRRETADPLSLAVGQRIRALRKEAGLTIERLAYESDLGSKGHLSNIERGLVRPTIQTLKVLADGLGVLPLDLLTFPADDERQALVDYTRGLRSAALRGLHGRAQSGAEPGMRAAERRAQYATARRKR